MVLSALLLSIDEDGNRRVSVVRGGGSRAVSARRLIDAVVRLGRWIVVVVELVVMVGDRARVFDDPPTSGMSGGASSG